MEVVDPYDSKILVDTGLRTRGNEKASRERGVLGSETLIRAGKILFTLYYQNTKSSTKNRQISLRV
jgi:hypothetical protein